MYNRGVKFGLKIPNRLRKNVRKPQGVFFDSRCILRSVKTRLFIFHDNAIICYRINVNFCTV